VTVHYDEYDGEEFLFAFAQDIADRKEAELKFEQQAAELLHASRLSTVGEMVAALSHEVAQPLSAVGNFAAACEKILSKPFTNHNDDLSEYIGAILKQNRRCAAILQRLRDYSKRTPDCRTQCDLAHLVRESVELVSSDLRSHNVNVRFDLPQVLPTVLADRVQLQQVFVNLLTNARDAVCDEPDERRTITIRAAAERDAVVLHVDDLGKGFENGGVEHLFEPFYTTKKNGMGIGLSICQSIVHEHGGKIEASTNDAGGASFHVRLPLPRSQQA
jgi:C4-dicarboxylate-specific signal transduction histidine kinase